MEVYVNVLVLDRNRILLIKEKGGLEELPNKKFIKPSKWGMPGGVKEPEESEKDAAVREVREETGLWIEIESGIRIQEEAEDHLNVTLLGYPIGGKLKASTEETKECRWFPIGILWDRNFDMYSSHRRRAKELKK